MLRTLTLYLHPVARLAAIAIAGYDARLGLRSRSTARDAGAARRRHAALGPWLYALMVLNWAGGLATMAWLRPEETAGTGHFTIGTVIVAVLTVGAVLSRWVPVAPAARTIHPLLGAAALLLCGFQVFLGLQLLP